MADLSDSATLQAYRKIRDDILAGVLSSGTMLGEAALAAEIGVSRTPVRTALARLQEEGWITIYPKRGALVQGLSDRAITDLSDARLILETTSVQRATPRAREMLADRLDDAIREQVQAFRTRDLRRFIELTIAFHRSFVESSRNEVLLELNDRLADRQRFLLFSHGDRLLARCESIIEEHQLLAHSLRANDVPTFSDILRSHFSDNYGKPLDPVCPPR